jgi:murein DD-endopeptidase MepM/ murein hydrolase activator NlpD
MDINKTYSVIVLRGTQMRRFVISLSGIRCLIWAALCLLLLGVSSLSDYVAAQQNKVHELVAKARAQRASVSSLREKTTEVRALLNRWNGFRQKIQASLPRRFRASHDGRRTEEELQQMLGSLQKELAQMIASLPTEWPVQGRVVSGVGMRMSPLTGKKEFHAGLDIPNPQGTPVHASGDAVVESTGVTGGNGRNVVLDHGEEITTRYAHLSKILVSEGEHVHKGQLIGLVGSSGKSTGPHLHYEVRVNGIPIDPRKGLMGAVAEN